ncbi:DUF4393 domain-containing protein [Mycobacterium sp. MYCO198283]|uniref:DUF4393 domain-containing protein n=1 Tax=Mycobacterium sp. MYCO198283 TaxID=2883505 RepID=UPI001E440AF3|nr:DUF4393 domain-containing protein [Mycobacterium sp. MYCO198283]MCG5434163.1 DUF4393 domain-containing protein [Mycobacterium sp. MYCO198283]
MAVHQVMLVALHAAGRSVGRSPVVNDVLTVLADAERTVIKAVRAHLAAVDPPPEAPAGSQLPPPRPEPVELMRTLLDQSMYNRPADSRTALYANLIGDMVPDEARILAALSDGTAYPVIDVAEPMLGTSSAVVLSNASTVGRAAGVSLPDRTPLYVSRLVLAGLAHIGPEGPNTMFDDYEMLLTDAAVNAAIGRARRGMRSARVIRRTVRITELGSELWEAAT